MTRLSITPCPARAQGRMRIGESGASARLAFSVDTNCRCGYAQKKKETVEYIMLKLLTLIYGNRLGQEALESIMRKCQRYMGIGSGDDVLTSGESGVLKRVRALNSPPYCIFDVGSHKGQYLDQVLSVMEGEDFSVHCFEPSRRQFGMLSEKAGENRRVILNNLGLGREKGELDLFYDTEESGGSLTKRHLEHIGIEHWHSEKVRIDTVDNYCRANGVEYIHLLKADIEGHEMELFLGALGMFEKHKIGAATFEFGGCDIDTRIFFKDFFGFFKEKGMEIYRITPAGYLYHLPDYREIDEQFRTTNFVAVKNDL